MTTRNFVSIAQENEKKKEKEEADLLISKLGAFDK